MSKPLPAIISADEAYRQGKVRYFTGKPCKKGHISERYVNGGSCVECHAPRPRRIHPTHKGLLPYVCPRLWAPDLTPEEYLQLGEYLQSCIYTFWKYKRPGEFQEPTSDAHT